MKWRSTSPVGVASMPCSLHVAPQKMLLSCYEIRMFSKKMLRFMKLQQNLLHG